MGKNKQKIGGNEWIINGTLRIGATGVLVVDPGGTFDSTPSAPEASELAYGAIMLASTAEAIAGADTAKAVTAAGLEAHTPAATTSAAGKVELATDAEAITGTDTARAVTPHALAAVTATETRAGLVELATTVEAAAGADTDRAVTAAGLAAYAPAASATAAGKVELATDAEAQAGSDSSRAVTPHALGATTGTTARAGILELATDGEAQTGTDTARAITPANLQAVTGTETRKGVLELATDAEAQTGTDTARAITPANLQAVLKSDAETIASAGLGTVRKIHGQITASNAAIASGTIAGVRGLVTLSGNNNAGGAYFYGAQGKFVVPAGGVLNHADSRACGLIAQVDATDGTLSAGMLSGVWIDMLGITGIPFAEFNAIRITTNKDAKFTSLVYAQSDAAFFTDLVTPTGGAMAFVAAAGVNAASCGNAAGVAAKVMLARINGVTYYIPLFAGNT